MICAQWIAPYGETALVTTVWAPPSAEHWLGGDQLGRDMLTRMIYGAQTTITVALIATVLVVHHGILAGFTAAVVRGAVDQVLSRIGRCADGDSHLDPGAGRHLGAGFGNLHSDHRDRRPSTRPVSSAPVACDRDGRRG